MAGNTLTLASTSFSRSVARVPPPISGLVLWSFLGGSLAQSQNLVGTPLTNIGSGPIYPPPGNYAKMTHATGALQLAVADVAGSFTLMTVTRVIEPNGYGVAISNYATGPNQGADFAINNTAGINPFVAGGGLVFAPSMPLKLKRGLMSWKFLAIAYQSGVDGTIYDLTEGTSQTATAAGSNRTLSAQPWQLGQNPAGTNIATEVDLAFAGIARSYLDATAIGRAYQSVRESLALTGMRI